MAYTFQFPSRQQAKSTTPEKVKLDEVNNFYAAVQAIIEHEVKALEPQLTQPAPAPRVTC